MKIKVFADTICGWCYIGHSRQETINKALEEFKDIKFEIEHMPFQLNPDMPKKELNEVGT
jgi:predicted DsbA family dithiol-disulfide isomerase